MKYQNKNSVLGAGNYPRLSQVVTSVIPLKFYSLKEFFLDCGCFTLQNQKLLKLCYSCVTAIVASGVKSCKTVSAPELDDPFSK